MSSGDRGRDGFVDSPPLPDDLPLRPRHVLRFDLTNVALATVVVVLVIRAFSFVDLIRNVILLLVLAILLATAIDPLVTRLRRGGLSRVTSVLGISLSSPRLSPASLSSPPTRCPGNCPSSSRTSQLSPTSFETCPPGWRGHGPRPRHKHHRRPSDRLSSLPC